MDTLVPNLVKRVLIQGWWICCYEYVDDEYVDDENVNDDNDDDNGEDVDDDD